MAKIEMKKDMEKKMLNKQEIPAGMMSLDENDLDKVSGGLDLVDWSNPHSKQEKGRLKDLNFVSWIKK
jgi:hypothetical protein